MNTANRSIIPPAFVVRAVLLAMLLLGPSLAQAQPSVSNVRAAQRAGSNLVDIYYDLGGQAQSTSVSLEISSDGGATHTVPAASLTGHVGSSVAAGSNRKITWNAGADWANQFSSAMRVKISATGGAPTNMALIPAGSFEMGNQMDPNEGDSAELPVHTVNVSAFYMDRYEVTKALWDEVRAWGLTNGYTDLPAGSGKAANHPVYYISWYEAVKWCNARSRRENLTECYTVSGVTYKTGSSDSVVCNFSANGYRLPTEAEWEKAARGGLSGKRFPWGDTITHGQANYYSYAWGSYDVSPTRGYHPTYGTGSTPYSSPVGSFAPNSYGLYDMAGNMWEWCWDWYSESYYSSSPSANPIGPSSGWQRVVRPGNWGDWEFQCRVAYRRGDYPNYIYHYGGFRSARSSVP
jgi:formylglycine-generating enzyme required for sulfatase activity